MSENFVVNEIDKSGNRYQVAHFKTSEEAEKYMKGRKAESQAPHEITKEDTGDRKNFMDSPEVKGDA